MSQTQPTPEQISSAAGPNVLLGLGSAIIFAVSVTNSIVYAQGTTSSHGSSSGSGGDEDIGVNTNCATLMLVINIIIAIISFIAMIYFFYKAVYSKKERQAHLESASATAGKYYYYNSGYQLPAGYTPVQIY